MLELIHSSWTCKYVHGQNNDTEHRKIKKEPEVKRRTMTQLMYVTKQDKNKPV